MEEQQAPLGEEEAPATHFNPTDNNPIVLDQTGSHPADANVADIIAEPVTQSPRPDSRLYVPKQNGWEAVIKQSWEREHCYAKNPGEDWFHLLANGEIYVQRGAEKYCLTCALQMKILTRNRLFWQKGSRGPDED